MQSLTLLFMSQDREKDIMLSLWISRVWEPSLYLLGAYFLILTGCVPYRSVQSQWVAQGFHNVSLKIHESQLHCRHGFSDAFYGSIIFNVTIMAMLNVLTLILGFFSNQYVPPVNGNVVGRADGLKIGAGRVLEAGDAIWFTSQNLRQEQEESYDISDLSVKEHSELLSQYRQESGDFRKRSSTTRDILKTKY